MKIETDRLELIVLSPGQMDMWLHDIGKLEKELGCSYQAEPMDGIFREIVAAQAEITKKDPQNYIWHSFWFIIRKEDNVVVGSADFKDIPDEKGEIEIGYGLGKQFEHNGYMTEAVKAMCGWARSQKEVRRIIAETDVDGFRSQRILKRCGFKEYKRGDTVWWNLVF